MKNPPSSSTALKDSPPNSKTSKDAKMPPSSATQSSLRDFFSSSRATSPTTHASTSPSLGNLWNSRPPKNSASTSRSHGPTLLVPPQPVMTLSPGSKPLTPHLPLRMPPTTSRKDNAASSLHTTLPLPFHRKPEDPSCPTLTQPSQLPTTPVATSARSANSASTVAVPSPSTKHRPLASNPSPSKVTLAPPPLRFRLQSRTNFKSNLPLFLTFEEAVALGASLGLTVTLVSLPLSPPRNKASGENPSPSSLEQHLHHPRPRLLNQPLR